MNKILFGYFILGIHPSNAAFWFDDRAETISSWKGEVFGYMISRLVRKLHAAPPDILRWSLLRGMQGYT